ncbi:MAG: hypothetical protein OXC48_01285 [Endozoicomonadaceae bacterium]|nr:hypothetical protein [Endozoicomonadaceae bacterium]
MLNRVILLSAMFTFFCFHIESYGHSYYGYVKNSTPWKITFIFTWTGCGAFRGPGIHHKQKIKIKKGKAEAIIRDCIWGGKGASSSLTPVNHKTGKKLKSLKLKRITRDIQLMYDAKKVRQGTDHGYYWAYIKE